MKKMILTAIIMVILSVNASAGDLPEAVMYSSEIDVIIGTIIEISGESATVRVSKSIFELITDETVTVNDFKYMAGSGVMGTTKFITPGIGDFCAAVVVPKEDGVFVLEGLCAKSDSLDSNTLKLEGNNEFIERMNEYINTGYYSKEKRDSALQSISTAVPEPVVSDDEPATSLKNFNIYLILSAIGILIIVIFAIRRRH